MKKFSRTCSSIDCSTRKVVGRSSSSFFRFPLDEARCKIWCLRSGQRDLLNKSAEELHKKYFLCSKHFNESQFHSASNSKIKKRLRLIPKALPNSSNDNDLPDAEIKTSNTELKNQLDFDCINDCKFEKIKNINCNQQGLPNTCERINQISNLPSSGFGKHLTFEGSSLPYLEVCILHSGYNHERHHSSDQTCYKFRDTEGDVIDIASSDAENDAVSLKCTEDVCFEDKGKTLTIPRSLINNYRLENDYYGPLQVVSRLSNPPTDGVVGSAISFHFEPIDVAVTQKEDRSLSDHELHTLMHQNPGFIPACDPPVGDDEGGENYTVYSYGGKDYKISNKVLSCFSKYIENSAQFEIKEVDEIFHTSDDRLGLIPVTVLFIVPMQSGSGKKAASTRKKKLLRKRRKDINKESSKEESTHSYDVNYNNWSQRGSACFNEIKRVGIRFIDGLVRTNLLDEDLQEFGNSFSSNTESANGLIRSACTEAESSYPEGSKELADELWVFLCNRAKNDANLIEFQCDMDKEKWIEIKRVFNVFQIDWETVHDITLKVVHRIRNNQCVLNYYIRCLGRLVKTGSLSSKRNVVNIINTFDKNKYVCIGLDKDRFIYQLDENEKMRTYIKECGFLSTVPFESLHHRRCKAVVRDTVGIENYKFQRGKAVVYGPLVVCKPCEELFDKLEALMDPSLDISSPRKDQFTPPKQRYGPMDNVKVSKKIQKLCTETPFEFVSDSQREIESFKKLGIETDMVSEEERRLCSLEVGESEDDRPTVRVSESEFEKMMTFRREGMSSSGGSDKICNECGFEARSMLALFTHMSSHIVFTREECTACSAKFPSKKALNDHRIQVHSDEMFICSICQQTFLTNDDYIYHLNSHRSIKPFVCLYCDQRAQTIVEYKKHMKAVHNMERVEDMNFGCRVCQTYFYTRDHLFIHQLNSNHLNKDEVKCSICSYTCSSITSFESHILTHSSDQRESNNLALCRECRKFFFSSYEMDDHIKRKQCRCVTKDTTHVTEIHPDKSIKNQKIFNCEKCFKIRGTINTLHKHVDSAHADDKSSTDGFTAAQTTTIPTPSMTYAFSCNICGMKFTSEYFLNIHMNFHTNTRPVFQSENVSYMYTKRNDDSKQVEKQQQMMEQQPQQLATYNHLFVTPQQTGFEQGQVPAIVTHSQAVHVTSADQNWNQQHSSSNINENQESVYSLLHL